MNEYNQLNRKEKSGSLPIFRIGTEFALLKEEYEKLQL